LDQIYVFFPNDDKVGMKHIKKYVEMMTHENVSRAVLVLQQNLTPFAKSFLIELEPKIHLEIFQVSFLHTKKKLLLQFDRQHRCLVRARICCCAMISCVLLFLITEAIDRRPRCL
jgi:hypothetical protein